MKGTKQLLIAFALLSFGVSNAQYFVSSTDLGVTASTVINILAGAGTYDVQTYKIVYNTTDIDGTNTLASGVLSVPLNANCTSYSIGAYNHGTVLQRENVPSRDNGEAFITKATASQGIITVSPDYLGLGDNPGLHPYLHAASQATATLDLLRAAREFVKDSLNFTLNGEVFVTGYSQGGHAAMATVKMVQDSSLQNEFNIVAAGPASGPYNLSGSQSEVLISNQPYSNPGYVCYLLFGLNRVYGNLYNTYSDILKAPYDTLIPPYFDGTYPMDSVNAKLPSRLADFMQDTVLANFVADSINKTHPLWRALLAQDNYDWLPLFPMRMYYCTQDEQVSFQNALDAEMAMNARGATTVTALNKGALNHGGCITPSLFDARDWFLSLASACNIGINEQKLNALKAYPNPVVSKVKFEGLLPHELLDIKLYSYSGAVVKKYSGAYVNSIDLSELPSGIYIMHVKQKGQEQILKVVKK